MKLNIPCDEEKIKETILLSRKAYYQSEAAAPLPWFDFFVQQGRYIQKRWWLMQGILLAAVLLLFSLSGTTAYLQKCLGVTAPLFVVLTLPELWKNRACGAMEVEGSAFYTLRQIYAARLSLFVGVDFLLISVFLLGVSYFWKLTLWEMLISFALPFNVSCCICFRCLYSAGTSSELFPILLCMAWTVLWGQFVLMDSVYTSISPRLWAGMLVLSTVFLIYSVVCGQRKISRIWERKPLWS